MRWATLFVLAAACGPPQRPAQKYEPARAYLLATFADGVRAYPPEGGPGRHVVGSSYLHGHGLAVLPGGGFLLGGRRLEASKERDALEFTRRFEFVAVRIEDAAIELLSHLVVMPGGNLVVSDGIEDNLVVFDAELNRLGEFAVQDLGSPGAILVRDGGDLWVAARTTHSIEKLAADGRALGRLVSGIDGVAEMVELPGNEVAVALNTARPTSSSTSTAPTGRSCAPPRAPRPTATTSAT
jgi:hypothetical protein